MHWEDSFLLGIVEGLTEFLPVSSTGHLILVSEVLGYTDEGSKSLEVVIQLGAIVAVVLYYRTRLMALVKGILRREPQQLRLLMALAVGFLPAAVVGLAVHKAIKARLFFKGPVSLALVFGGVLMIAIELYRRASKKTGATGLDQVTPLRALVIGCAQCMSLLPGMSRSMSTIIGGQLAGLSTETAAEFSFLLAIPTLGAATVFDLAKHRKELLEAPGSAEVLLVGLAVSFVVSVVVIAGFLQFLKRWGLAAFGVYRIAFGALVLFYTVRHGEKIFPKPEAETSGSAAPAASPPGLSPPRSPRPPPPPEP